MVFERGSVDVVLFYLLPNLEIQLVFRFSIDCKFDLYQQILQYIALPFPILNLHIVRCPVS